MVVVVDDVVDVVVLQFRAVMEQDVSEQASMATPQLYQVGIKNNLFNPRAIFSQVGHPVCCL